MKSSLHWFGSGCKRAVSVRFIKTRITKEENFARSRDIHGLNGLLTLGREVLFATPVARRSSRRTWSRARWRRSRRGPLTWWQRGLRRSAICQPRCKLARYWCNTTLQRRRQLRREEGWLGLISQRQCWKTYQDLRRYRRPSRRTSCTTEFRHSGPHPRLRVSNLKRSSAWFTLCFPSTCHFCEERCSWKNGNVSHERVLKIRSPSSSSFRFNS